MKKILGMLLAVATLACAAVALSSCGAPDDPGAQIKVYLGDPIYDFDPTDYYSDSNADQMMSLLYEPLFTVDEDGELDCAAAEDYEVDEDNRTIVIELRESYWSDGVSRVSAEDFIFAWRDVLLEPNKPNPAASLLYDIEGALDIKQGKVSNSQFGASAKLFEITIKYREGADYEQLLKNLASVATSPIKQDSVSQAPTYWSKSSNTLVTNGPFRISTLNYLTGELVLDRNVGYHQNPNVEDYDDEVIPAKLISFISTDGAPVEYTYQDIQNKVVFFMSDAPLYERTNSKNKAVLADDLSTYTYVFNTQNPLFKNKYVRQALSLAVDRATIVNALTYAKAADGFLPDIVKQNSDKKLISSTAKLDEALNLLAQVDFTGLDKSFTLTVNNDQESLVMAELVAENWRYLGFEVTVKAVSVKKTTLVDFSTNSEMEISDSELQIAIKEASYGNMTFDVLGMDWQMYSTDAFVPLSAFTSHMNGNGATFNNPETILRSNITAWSSDLYDSYMDSAYQSSGDTRTEYLKKAEELLVDSAVVIPVIYNQSFAYVHEDIDDLVVDGFGNFVWTEAELDDYEQYLN